MGCQSRLDRTNRTIHFGSILLGVLTAACLCGCRTGSSWSGPSWSMFGGSAAKNEKLASAPPFEGDVAKPSTTANPYPTTSSPDGYALENVTGRPAAPSLPAEAASPTAVVYGSTPPAAAAPPPAPAAMSAAMDGRQGYGAATAAGLASPISSITPQVGPYAATTPSSPSSDPAPLAAGVVEPSAAASVATPPEAGFNSSPVNSPVRVADARAATPWNAERSPAPNIPSADAAAARYEAGSRFSSNAGPGAATAPGFSQPGGQPGPDMQPPPVSPTAVGNGFPEAAPASRYTQPRDPQPGYSQPGYSQPYPQAAAPQPAFPQAGATNGSGFGAAPAAAPAAFSLPPGNGPVAMPQTVPAQTPPAPAVPAGQAAPGQAPARRADPVYRPGGTSSFQRNDAPETGVLPASFDQAPAPLP